MTKTGKQVTQNASKEQNGREASIQADMGGLRSSDEGITGDR